MQYRIKLIIASLCLLLAFVTQAADSVVWHFNQLSHIGGHSTQTEGQPELNGQLNKYIRFNGVNDRIQVLGNPVAGMASFTLELLVKPEVPKQDARAPRIIHIEEVNNSQHRLTLEMRFNDNNQWYMDAFLLDGDSRFTLIDSSLTHKAGQWFNIAITYHAGQFTSFVNGQQELSAKVRFSPMSDKAHTSVGARMNQVHYFYGELAQLKATDRVLKPEEMLQPPEN